eukprot:TRINITY_DN12100_c0_g4_i1.p2 TRINITY_DN12100_c0_g4~~TRINITY_DN12100_c0_g4_i1.p2  ORF type:complete len:248 (-),score=27.22 TRINITY_DN12100_c0_g4_i1:329-1072(-)
MNIDILKVVDIARLAGEAILNIYQEDFDVEYKDDKSPLTKADKEANRIITEELKKLYPDIPILSEEGKEVAYQTRKDWDLFWLIDPLDGTKEFIKKNGEFTVNIALIKDQTPVVGVVYAPVLQECYYAKSGEGAYKDGEKLPFAKNSTYKVVASKSHRTPETDEFIESLKQTHENLELVSKGSSLKLCLVASGEADIYPRLAPTMEWDTAAAHAVVNESGKKVYEFTSKKELVYNKENLLNPWFVVE